MGPRSGPILPPTHKNAHVTLSESTRGTRVGESKGEQSVIVKLKLNLYLTYVRVGFFALKAICLREPDRTSLANYEP
jgi:hypothetical protein